MRIRGQREAGAALVIVMWIAFGLVSMALYFGHSMSLELRKAANIETGTEAEQAIEGAGRYVQYILSHLVEPGRLPLPTEYLPEAAPLEEASFWLVGRDYGAADTRYPYFHLMDEAGKLNLNTATRDQLIKLPGMTEEFAAAIIDWRDENDEVTENGAESEVYLRLNPPYPAKNNRFEVVDELRLVKGATPALLYGEDANRNGILDPNENDGSLTPPEDDQDGVLDFGLLEFLTARSVEPNLRTNGEPRIFVGLGQAVQGGGGNNNGSGAGPGGASGQQQLLDLLNETLGESRAGEIMGRLGAGQFASLLEFYMRSQMSLEEFALIDDSLTTSTNALLEGLVNVNTASAEVLATLADLEYSEAQSLVNYRTTNPGLLNTVGWVSNVLQEDKARALGPFITDKGYQYSADISAVGRHGRGYRRSLMIFDLSEGAPVVIYRREMTREGWALGMDLREEMMAMREQRR